MVYPRTTREVILLRWRRSAAALYVAALLFSLQGGVVMTAVPWRVMALGGGESAVGLAGGLQMGIYAVGCIFLGPFADRIGPKRLVMLGTAGMTFTTAAMTQAGSVRALLWLVAINAGLTTMFWPPVMGWLSTGHEKASLNRRLGIFNLCWSSGLIVGNFLGGLFFNIQQSLPFAVGSGVTLMAFISAASARRQRSGPVVASEDPSEPVAAGRLPLFRLMARIALFAGWIVLGALRYPFAAFLKQDLAAGADVHGAIGAGLSFALMTGFVLLGRTHRWHYRYSLFWGSQVLTVLMVALIFICRTAWQAAGLSVVAALAMSVLYASDLFYGVSGGRRRAGSMAIHEVLLATGFVVGSLGGGLLAESLGPRYVFPAAAGLVLLGFLLQVGLWALKKRSKPP